jgi:hypothetical protein
MEVAKTWFIYPSGAPELTPFFARFMLLNL